MDLINDHLKETMRDEKLGFETIELRDDEVINNVVKICRHFYKYFGPIECNRTQN